LRQLGENPLADVDDPRIELRACAFVEAAQGFLLGEPLPVRAVRRHRVVRVADQDDPRFDRDVIAAEAVRIAGAVETLVTVSYDRLDILETVDRRDDPLAQLRMRLDDP